MKKTLIVCVLGVLLGATAAAAPGPRADLPGIHFSDVRRALQEAEIAGPIPTPPSKPAPAQALPRDMVRPPSMPAIGKWMLDKDGNVAHWLGWDYAPGRLDEPINVIVRVKADTADEANQKLLKALADAGFSIRLGHTNGYQAYLGTGRYRFPQWPAASGGTFSDGAATGPNNHGRLFGPVRFRGMYYFIGAFSWEDGPVHAYKSFKNARDAFARQMQALAGAVRGPDVPLDNAIPPGSSPIETTDDHDGSAALIELP